MILIPENCQCDDAADAPVAHCQWTRCPQQCGNEYLRFEKPHVI